MLKLNPQQIDSADWVQFYDTIAAVNEASQLPANAGRLGIVLSDGAAHFYRLTGNSAATPSDPAGGSSGEVTEDVAALFRHFLDSLPEV